MITTICGSVIFTPSILEVANELEIHGNTVRLPYFTEYIRDGHMTYQEFVEIRKTGDISLREQHDVDFYTRYWNYIKESDNVLIMNMEKNGIEGYIGGNTLIEMGFAHINNKPIYLYNPIPERGENMHYVDEIRDFEPRVLHQDLSALYKKQMQTP